jgi:hypothetical protein
MTVAETAPFIRQAAKLWTQEDRYTLVDFIAANPDADNVIPDTGGLRKIRWGRRGVGNVAASGLSISTTTTRCRCFSC